MIQLDLPLYAQAVIRLVLHLDDVLAISTVAALLVLDIVVTRSSGYSVRCGSRRC